MEIQNEIRVTQSKDETQSLAREIAGCLQPGEILTLTGELGSGKTTFVQGLAMGLRIKQKILSPTFLIVRRYEVSSKYQVLSIKYFYHIDLYRVEHESDLRGLGLEEILEDKESVSAIEWPAKLGSLLPQRRIDLTFTYIDDHSRQIIIKKYE